MRATHAVRLGLAVGAMAAVMAGHARAQGPPPYTWKYWFDRQEAYESGPSVKVGQPPQWVKRSIRFINIEYDGSAKLELWKRAFADAAAHYKKEGISYRLGRDGDFFTVEGLSASRQRLVGWADDSTGESGFVAIQRVTVSRVYYTISDGRQGSASGPDNFVSWSLGFLPGDWDSGSESLVSVQVWKHRDVGTQAGVTFRFRSRQPK